MKFSTGVRLLCCFEVFPVNNRHERVSICKTCQKHSSHLSTNSISKNFQLYYHFWQLFLVLKMFSVLLQTQIYSKTCFKQFESKKNFASKMLHKFRFRQIDDTFLWSMPIFKQVFLESILFNLLSITSIFRYIVYLWSISYDFIYDYIKYLCRLDLVL